MTKIWEQYPEFKERFDEIQSFCQANSFSEEDVWEIASLIEEKDIDTAQEQLTERKEEIKNLLKSIEFVYDYLGNLKND